MAIEMVVNDLYLKYVSKDGSSRVEHHRVWDGDAFVKARMGDTAKEGGTVHHSSQAEYRAAKWPKRVKS